MLRAIAAALAVASSAVFVSCAGPSKVLAPERVPGGMPTARPEGPEWIDLLAGEHASKWKNATDNADIFRIENGELIIPGTDVMRHAAYMGEAFGDFDLHLEFKLGAEGVNSGVFVRSAPEDPVYKGMEIQVLADHGKAPGRNGCGAIYDVATPMFNMVRPAGAWNSYDISCTGPLLSVVFNGWKVLEVDLSKLTMPVGKFDTPLATLPQSGHILLQDHGGAAVYRNIVVRKR